MTGTLTFNEPGQHPIYVGRKRKNGVWISEQVLLDVSWPDKALGDDQCLDYAADFDQSDVNLYIQAGETKAAVDLGKIIEPFSIAQISTDDYIRVQNADGANVLMPVGNLLQFESTVDQLRDNCETALSAVDDYQIKWELSGFDPGLYAFKFKYASGEKDLILSLSLNENVVTRELIMQKTSDWTDWQFTDQILLSLEAGP